MLWEGQLYVLGYRGEGAGLVEVLACLDAETGLLRWEQLFPDFLSDTAHARYGVGSPVVDPETGNVFAMSSAGLLSAFSIEGTILWQHSLAEELGRVGFPDGKTGSPVVAGDLVVIHAVTSGWGELVGPSDRFYAFDKTSGALAWVSTPGLRAGESAFSTPVLGWYEGRQVLYSGTACGHVVCVAAGDGRPLWRYRLSKGGVGASVLVHEGRVFAVYGEESLDRPRAGGMVMIDPKGALPRKGQQEAAILGRESLLWRNDLGHSTSSPVLAGGRIYQVTPTGSLSCADAGTGTVLWTKKLANEQLHASPLLSGDKLFVPMRDGSLHVLEPDEAGAELLSTLKLDGSCMGAPVIADGKLYVHTTEKLYALDVWEEGAVSGSAAGTGLDRPPAPPARQVAVGIQVRPAEVVLEPGQRVVLSAQPVGPDGSPLGSLIPGEALEAIVAAGSPVGMANGRIGARADAPFWAGTVRIRMRDLAGIVRVRIVARVPYKESFDGFVLRAHPSERKVRFTEAPASWMGGAPAWEVRAHKDGNVLTKITHDPLHQRAVTFFGHPAQSEYDMQVDLMSEGDERTMGDAGVVHQRYVVALKGSWQKLEVSSNHSRLKASVPFSWKPGTWYRLKSAVKLAPDGTAKVYAKVWPRAELEPEAWTIEVPHAHPHPRGAPGLFAFTPQNRAPVYLDNISVVPHGFSQ